MKFVLNDENKVNSYGFKVLNKGIDLSRFESNPVMLDQHINSTKTVVGRWINIRVEGSCLVADSEFDTADPEAKSLEGKVERGFINGASIGISSSPLKMVKGKDGIGILNKCEIFEASICAIPSNANAITLYSKSGELITKKAFNLSFYKHLNDTKMDLQKALIDMLGLPQDATDDDIIEAVQAFVDDKESDANKKALSLINLSIEDGRILPIQKEFFLDSLKRDYEKTSKVIQSLLPKKSLRAMIIPNDIGTIEDTSKWTLDDYRKLAPKELIANPELFQRLLDDENGVKLRNIKRKN